MQPGPHPHHEALETAFLQLSFAMKIWHFVRSGGLQRESFDIALTAVDDAGVPYVTLEGEFQSDDDLILASENNVSICFAAAAITLWEAIREHSGLECKTLSPSAYERDSIAGLAFAIRCCFAHGTAAPRWKLTPKYRLRFELPGLSVDLTSADGQPFDYSYLGGPDGLRVLRRAAASASLV
jgi:hypothetical protein